MHGKLILVVEDERAIRDMIAFALKRAGYAVREAEDSRTAREALADRLPDLMLVDWMLPDMSGLELTRAVKRDRHTRELPIIMLTARAEEGDKITGLENGADDYVTKPFSPRELVARIGAVLRRAGTVGLNQVLEFEGLKLDQEGQRITINDEVLPLARTEFRMLEFFMSRPERVFSREQLIARLWGSDTSVEDRTIDVCIRRLRMALEPYGMDRYIQTVRSAGYRFSNKAQ
ncbi:MAG: phosphate regulon transcriptional regulatory protein PhoB [Proteobacteria bacterium]|nr:phosphate regulon transcriptional regulatory protein PhoB [Pseudomonadota bacterium]